MPLQDDDDDNDKIDTTSSKSPTSTIPFLLADIGEGISEVELLQWYVNPGDTVSQFDRICEVQSDKATVEITSRFDGVVERLCGEVGEMMFVGKPLLYIAVDNVANVGGGGDLGSQSHQHAAAESVDEMKQQATLHNVDDESDQLHIPTDESVYSNFDSHYGGRKDSESEGEASGIMAKVLSSPAVRKMSKDYNIDLGAVIGTGPGGRVLKADILNIINARDSTAKPTGSTTVPQVSSASSQIEEDTVIPIRGYSRLMVKSMTTSLQVPHMVYADEINVNALTGVRDSLRPLAKEMGINKLTYLPFFIKASSLAITKYPVLNSTIDVEEMTLTYHQSHNVGVAVDTERGLTVPVVKRCQDKSVLEIAEELGRLYALVSLVLISMQCPILILDSNAKRFIFLLHYQAFEGNLSEADISDCTLTLSNIGAIGGTYMSPVVLPPQVAVGAMGKIQRLPRFVSDTSDEVESVRIMPISWGGDHRAVDGATMARFSNLWKAYVENPSSMMFAMR
jgi:2-oxoisovalerate dehydrogenase E2 component (dihydrolipoyl transacylase)